MRLDWKITITIFLGILLIIVICFILVPTISKSGSDILPKTEKADPTNAGSIHTNVSELFFNTRYYDISPQKTVPVIDETSYVPYEVARMHAEVELARTMYLSSRGLAGTSFSDVSVFPNPIIVYDNAGISPEYYKFYAGVRDNRNILLTIPASKRLGFQGLPSSLGSSDDSAVRMVLDTAQEYYDRNLYGSDIISVRLIASDCWGEIVQLDTIPEHSSGAATVFLDYGTPRNQESCNRVENSSIQAIPDRIMEWESGDSYYRSVRERARIVGINLSEPCSWDKRDRMNTIFESVRPPLISPM